MTDQFAQDPLAALTWLLEAGGEETIGETPVDRFVQRPPAAASRPGQPLPIPRTALAPKSAEPPSDMVANALALAAAATNLTELKAALMGFEGCSLRKSCANTVFADGNPASRVMFIGEAPGAEEDRQGLPFVGRAGKLLDKMMAAIHLDRSSAYITNVLNWRPPANRDPSPEEAAACLPFLRRHIELVNPGIIILLGAVAARHVMGFSEGIMKLRGRWLEYHVGGVMVPVIATLHPAYLLRQPAHKKLAWRDLQAAEEKMRTLGLPESNPHNPKT